MNQQAADGLVIERRLDAWAKSGLSVNAPSVVNDLAGLYRAAGHVVNAIDALTTTGVTAHEQGKALYAIETWLYQELESYAERLQPEIGKVIAQVYEHVPDEE